MERDDDDIQMLDARAQYAHAQSDYGGSFLNALNSTSGSAISNGHQDPRDDISDVGLGTAHMNGQTTREQSVLANDIKHVSIDRGRPDQDEVDAYLQDVEDEEPSPQLPFRSDMATGYCYDVRMRYHTELEPPENRRDFHPEDPRRIFSIYRELCVAGLIYDDLLTRNPLVSKPLLRVDARDVEEGEVCLVHTKQHWELMRATQDLSSPELIALGLTLDSVYLSGSTWGAALLSAGGAIETTRAVVEGSIKNAVAIIRPPGHHAECNRPMGFCIFDNVSIATKAVMREYPDEIKKVLILDWDVHHGNGIQQAFYDDPNVLYISLHVHEDGNFYPPGPGGDHNHIGTGLGEGRNINIPWPTKGMGDADYIFAFQQIVMPVAYEFNPDLIMIASGFDAADGDQLGGCYVTPACYAHMTHMLKSLADGKVVACLEGGYNLRSIARSALAVARTLNGEFPPRMADRRPTKAAVATVQLVRQTFAEYYDSFYPKIPAPPSSVDPNDSTNTSSYSLAKVSQAFFAQKMMEAHRMVSVTMRVKDANAELNNHVLITLNHDQKVPLLVLFHDPPEAQAIVDPVSGKINPSSSTIAAGPSIYRDNLVALDWCVIDVTVPAASDTQSVFDAATLAEKVWDQFVEHGDFTHVFFLGIGRAYEGQMRLINTKETFWQTVNGVVAIVPSLPPHESQSGGVGVPVLAAKPVNDELSIKTYHSRSLVFVSKDHSFWIGGGKEKKRRYGKVLASEALGVQGMIDDHAEEILAWIGARLGETPGE